MCSLRLSSLPFGVGRREHWIKALNKVKVALNKVKALIKVNRLWKKPIEIVENNREIVENL